MFDDISGQCVGVEEIECPRLYIVVSPDNAVEAGRLLSAHGIPHSVEGKDPNFGQVSRWPTPLPR